MSKLLVVFVVLFASACTDGPPCDRQFQTCDAAYDSARAACDEQRVCSTLRCPGSDNTCTDDEAMRACVEDFVAELCDTIDCTSVYTRRADLDICINMQTSGGCDTTMTQACPL